MNKYSIFFITGHSEVINGDSYQGALSHEGLSTSQSIDFYEEGDTTENWEWNLDKSEWNKK